MGDITSFPTCQGSLYLAAVLDLGSRRCVRCAMRDTSGVDQVLSAMRTRMRQKGDCNDNAVTEIFFSTLEFELVRLADPQRGPHGGVRVSRKLVQSEAAAFDAGLSRSRRVRSAIAGGSVGSLSLTRPSNRAKFKMPHARNACRCRDIERAAGKSYRGSSCPELVLRVQRRSLTRHQVASRMLLMVGWRHVAERRCAG